MPYTRLYSGKGRCCARGESEESVVHRRGSTQARESTLALKPMADVTRSPKPGYQWPHKKDLCPTKILKKQLAVDDFVTFSSNFSNCLHGWKTNISQSAVN